jgi:hypothetical protein
LDAPTPDGRTDEEEMTPADEEAREQLDDLLNLESGLSDATIKFIESLDKQLSAKGYLTAKQRRVLGEIWDKQDGGCDATVEDIY